MISQISRMLTNPALVSIAKNTDATVATKTSVNAIGRPTFILSDSNIDMKTKKFAATKEFLYQVTCLGIYLIMIVPIFKKGGFKVAKNLIFKNSDGFEHFKNLKEYERYRNIADILDLNKRSDKIAKLAQNRKILFCPALQEELQKENPTKYSAIKGSINLSNIIGSVIGLSIVSPQVSQSLVHKVLND